MNTAELGDRIRKCRERFKLSQLQLAHSLHVSPQAVSKWERGINAPDLSVLPLLSNVLQTSLDDLLLGPSKPQRTFRAAVITTSIRGFAERASTLSPQDVAVILNSIFQPITQIVLENKGVPLKYLGDGFLGYFSGADFESRAVAAVDRLIALCVNVNLHISLVAGEIFLGSIGFGEYAAPDIIGDSVNLAFLLNQWAAQDPAIVAVAAELSGEWQLARASEAAIGNRIVPVKIRLN